LARYKGGRSAAQNGWTLAQAEGYVDGQTSRKRGKVPSNYTLIGIDDYCLGFRAGYFAIDRKIPSANDGNEAVRRRG